MLVGHASSAGSSRNSLPSYSGRVQGGTLRDELRNISGKLEKKRRLILNELSNIVDWVQGEFLKSQIKRRTVLPLYIRPVLTISSNIIPT